VHYISADISQMVQGSNMVTTDNKHEIGGICTVKQRCDLE